jgi:predicted AAA+ superfamily ATPase
MAYIKRIIEQEIADKLSASGAILIKGPKFCGKTETAKQFAKSILEVDRDEQVPIYMQTQPQRLLKGATPRLIDEWQESPKLWNYVRHEVDDRKKKGQFILTGSANPADDAKLHSGAGRFTITVMNTMSWQEMGYSSGKIKMADLLVGKCNEIVDNRLTVEVIAERMVKGGFPATIELSLKDAMLINQSYIELLADVDMSRVSNVRRDPDKVRLLLKSLARNVATMVDNSTLEKDIKIVENADLSRPTIIDYLDALSRLMVFVEQSAFNPHIRSSASLRKSPKRHLCDVSLPIAILGLDVDAILNDVKYMGFLFETLAFQDIKVYAQANDAKVYHYRDSSGLEVDAVVQKRNGDYAAFEIKLGIGQIEEAAVNLNKFVKNIDADKTPLPKSLNVITGTGMSYIRNDGINVISLASLGK